MQRHNLWLASRTVLRKARRIRSSVPSAAATLLDGGEVRCHTQSQNSVFDEEWPDDFRWMQTDGKKLAAFLKNEKQSFQEHICKGLAEVQQSVLLGAGRHVQDTKEVVHEVIGGFKYSVESTPEQPLDHYVRTLVSGDGSRQSLLNLNAVAEDVSGPFEIGKMKISDSQGFLAFTLSELQEQPRAVVRDIESGEEVDTLQDVQCIEWFSDDKTVLYTQADSGLRPFRVCRHSMGQPQADDEVVLEERRKDCFVSLTKTKDGRLIVVNSNSKTSSEVHILDAGRPDSPARLVQAREEGLEYFVEHLEGQLLIMTNAGGALNNCLMTAPCDRPAKSNWQLLVPEREGVALEDLDVFQTCLVLWERRRGLPGISRLRLDNMDRVLGKFQAPSRTNAAEAYSAAVLAVDGSAELQGATRIAANESHVFQPEDGITQIRPGANADHSSSEILLYVSSPLAPEKPLRMALGSRALDGAAGKRQGLHCWQEWATSPDGTQIPLTIAGNIGTPPSSSTLPCLLQVYGAYGMVLETGFNPAARLLLDQGWTLAFAHVRGGGELGRRWHHAGRQQGKLLALQDAAACTEHLMTRGIASSGSLALRAESAGAVLAANLLLAQPRAFGAAVLRMPFLDLFTAMTDPQQQLTEHEWDEWGDPRAPGGMQLLQELCPYKGLETKLQAVDAAALPPVLVTTGLLDNRVPAWMPAKWVAALRVAAGNKCAVHLNVHPGGHFLTQEEEQRLDALETAFVLQSVGLAASGHQ